MSVWRIFLGNTLNDKPQTTLIRDQRVLIFHAHNLNSSLVGFIEKLKSSTIKPSQRVGLQFLLYTCVLVYMASFFPLLAAFWGASIGLDVIDRWVLRKLFFAQALYYFLRYIYTTMSFLRSVSQRSAAHFLEFHQLMVSRANCISTNTQSPSQNFSYKSENKTEKFNVGFQRMGKMQAQHFASHGVNITFNEHEFVKDSTQEPPEIYHDQNTPFFIISGARRAIQFTTFLPKHQSFQHVQW